MGDMCDHWDAQWKESIKYFLESSRSGALREFEHPFMSYLPKKGTTLEASCGTGRYVLPCGRVVTTWKALIMPPETVLEHSFAGPMAGLREAFRVLSRGGCAIIIGPQRISLGLLVNTRVEKQ
jgi:hypothetical protein